VKKEHTAQKQSWNYLSKLDGTILDSKLDLCLKRIWCCDTPFMVQTRWYLPWRDDNLTQIQWTH